MDTGSLIGGKYRLTREIGQGSMGAVWSAVHELLDRQVAIKFLTQSFEDPTVAAARFMAEAKAAALVKHRCVVDVFDFGTTEAGVSYMVQELLDGTPLSQLMCEGPAWPVRAAVRFLMDSLSGLAAVHDRGIVHRDLKPENIFVVHDSEGQLPKLLDFGISKADERPRDRRVPRPSRRNLQAVRLTAHGATLGTPAYMSPEQLRNLSTLDARADIYSLGCVLYEWLAGHCPFASTANYAELLDRIESREMTPLDTLRPDLGRELCAVVARAIEPNREQRYASAIEMRAALARVLDVLPQVQTRIQNPVPAPLPKTLPPPAITYRPATLTPSKPLPSVVLSSELAPSLPHAPSYALPPKQALTPSISMTRSEPAPTVLSSMAPASLPPGSRVRRRRAWLGALAVGLLLAGAPVAWRARSHSVSDAPRPVQPAAAEERAQPRPSVELPLGALPPEAPDHESMPVALEDIPDVAIDPPAEPPHRRHRDRASRAVRERPSAGGQEPAARSEPAPAQGKLLRSLDF